MLECGDGTIYTGITDDLERRLKAHKEGKGAKYTRGRGPLHRVYVEECGDHSTALRREIEINALSKEDKEALITCYEKRG